MHVDPIYLQEVAQPQAPARKLMAEQGTFEPELQATPPHLKLVPVAAERVLAREMLIDHRSWCKSNESVLQGFEILVPLPNTVGCTGVMRYLDSEVRHPTLLHDRCCWHADDGRHGQWNQW